MKHLLAGLLVIATVYVVTTLMVRLLPDAAVIALGTFGGDPALVNGYWASRDPTGFSQQLARVFRGDLGQTLDHSSVLGELATALTHSLPPLVLGIFVAFAISVPSLFAKAGLRHRLRAVADTMSLLPAFVFPFLFGPVLYATRYAGSFAATVLVLFTSIVVPLVIMMTSMLLRFLEEESARPYREVLVLNGLGTPMLERLHRMSALALLLPVFDRIVVAALVSILLAEPLLGLPGLGSLSARAIKTADPNLTVAMSTLFAAIVVFSGAFSRWLKSDFAATPSSRP